MSYILPKTNELNLISKPDNSSPQFNRYDFTITRSFKNNLDYPVSIIDRNNIRYSLPPTNTGGVNTQEFVIIETITFANAVNINTDFVSDVDNNEYVTILKETLSKQDSFNNNFAKQIVIEYKLTEKQFSEYRYNIYIEELDLTLTRVGDSPKVVHPYSNIGQSLILQKQANPNGFNYIVVINDPDNIHGERFINLGGRVYKVKVTKDKSMKPGVYLFTKMEEEYFNPHLAKPEYYFKFEDADEKVPLFRTANDAKDLGDVLSARYKELALKESEIKTVKSELDLKKLTLESELKTMENTYKRELMEKERIAKELDAELQREKVTRERIQMEYKHAIDMQSLSRKDASDFMKWLPTMLASVISVATIVIKLKSP